MPPVVPDVELLRRYAQTASRDDLATLVSRYVDLVYSAARRQLRDPHHAEDVTQRVFVILMRKAAGLRPQTVLASWLLGVTSMECRNFIRGESRRARRERKVAQMTPETGTATDDQPAWDDVAPHLDAALATLSAGDRDAVVLRYFQNRSYGEAASLLGTTEASVRQRVYRGLQKVRSVLASRGAVVTEAALGTALLAHGVEAAPPTLAGASVVAMADASAKITILKGTVAAMSVQSKAVLIAAAVVLATIGVTTFLLSHDGKGDATAGAAQAPSKATPPAPQPVPAAAPKPAAVAAAPAPAAPAAPKKPERKLFDVITAKTADERKGTRDGYDHIGFINKGDWVAYHDIDLGPLDDGVQVMFCAVVACPPQFAGNEIEVHIGSPDGPVAATLTVESSGDYGKFVPQVTPVDAAWRGLQDVYLVFSGGGFNLKSIKFVTDVRKADTLIPGTSYAQAKSVNENNRVLVNVRNGAWARYDGIDFGQAGMDGFEITYAVDEAHAGGTISVRLDRPDAPSIRDVSIESTGGRSLPHTMKLRKPVTGKHDVYLTFAGTDRGYQGLADVAWFRFGNAQQMFRQAALRPAPGQTTTTRPTTQPAKPPLPTTGARR